VKRLLISLTLAVALSSSAMGGDIPSGGIAPPPTNATTETTAPGDMETPGKAEVSSEALSALLSVFSFLT
jgi:hypothetical protein